MGIRTLFGFKRAVRTTGWRRSAKVNSVVLLIFSVALTGLLIASLATAINLALHLLINIASTLVSVSRLASSNFFMQVLNAPTRQEIDDAHSKTSWLGIGVASVRNIFHVSSFKTWCWVSLLLSSIPIHLLFNSTIFEMDNRGSDYHLTIATEKFVYGGDFYPPGASLTIPGFVASDDIGGANGQGELVSGYGRQINRSDYQNPLSPVLANISTVSKMAAGWERLDISQCMTEYVQCSGLINHRNVVLIVEKPDGWAWNDIWHLSKIKTDLWQQIIPADKPNHLFFDAQCYMAANLDINYGQTINCYNDCSEISDLRYDLNISYCLAEPFTYHCQLAVSPALLLGVTLCLITKTTVAIIVTKVLKHPKHKPLVTLGDAIESFIEQPDPITAGLCSIDQTDIRSSTKRKPVYLLPHSRKWKMSMQLWAATMPKSVWVLSYTLFAVGIILCAVLFNDAWSADQSQSYIPLSLTLNSGLLLANSPQLLLSCCYLAYNNLFTRLQMGREWTQFGEGYHPLRVTEPKGEQYSTYRLLLPYKYSIPLIAASAFLHWLVSNTIYVFVSTGGYFGTDFFSSVPFDRDTTLPANTSVAVGYSSTSLLVLIIVWSIMVLIPLYLASKMWPSKITQPGSNSLAISAACHSSTIPRPPRTLAIADDTIPESYAPVSLRSSVDLGIDSSHQLSPAENRAGILDEIRYWFSETRAPGKVDYGAEEQGDDDQCSPLRRLARSKVRWGVIEMPAEWYSEYDDIDGVVEHLGFGAEEDEPSDPIPGHMYA
ncbi:hypothetical protein F4678DRAFT_476639 [Xylaria arbuscula]|nr:hypothetical protein F4678DRAFT_476639 [Xylaria arbuscula]